jgi:hypothetical protein
MCKCDCHIFWWHFYRINTMFTPFSPNEIIRMRSIGLTFVTHDTVILARPLYPIICNKYYFLSYTIFFPNIFYFSSLLLILILGNVFFSGVLFTPCIGFVLYSHLFYYFSIWRWPYNIHFYWQLTFPLDYSIQTHDQ